MRILFEANFANGGDVNVEMKNTDGSSFEKLNSFNTIYETFVKSLPRMESKVAAWINGNFKNWLKNNAVGYDNHNCQEYLTPEAFNKLLYPSVNKTIDDLQSEFPEYSHDALLNMFPEYIKKDKNNAQIFCGGRRFRLKNSKFMSMMQELIDYANAVAENQSTRNFLLMPDTYFVNDLTKLSPAQALQNAVEYHAYLARRAEKISAEKQKAMLASLKDGRDFKVLKLFKGGEVIVKALNSKFTDVEGSLMKHCVATYGKAVDNKGVIIYSFRDQSGHPQATLELSSDEKKIKQLKGPHNGPVKNDFWDDIVSFIKEKKLSFSTPDYKNVGLKNDQPTTEEIQSSDFFIYESVKRVLLEASEPEKRTKTSFKDKPKFDGNLFGDSDKKEYSVSKAKKDSDKRIEPEDFQFKRGSGTDTKSKAANVKMDFKSFLHFMNMDLSGLEDEINPEDPTFDVDMLKPKEALLPSIMAAALRAAGKVDPTWHMVRNLPGYMNAGIRAIGRQVFTPFTSTKIENIQVIANLNNSGPNSESELRAVASFLLKHGTKQKHAEMEFQDRIPGYKAEMLVYTFANYTFLIVKDHAGHYVYSWPSTDNKTHLSDASLEKLKMGIAK